MFYKYYGAFARLLLYCRVYATLIGKAERIWDWG